MFFSTKYNKQITWEYSKAKQSFVVVVFYFIEEDFLYFASFRYYFPSILAAAVAACSFAFSHLKILFS